LEPGELTAQLHLAPSLEMVGEDELVALGEGVDADWRHHPPLEAQLLAKLAEHGRLRLLVPLQEPGDQPIPGLGPPHRADQEHVTLMLHQAGHHRKWVVVEDEATVRPGAGHSFAPARLPRGQRRGASRTETHRSLHERSSSRLALRTLRCYKAAAPAAA